MECKAKILVRYYDKSENKYKRKEIEIGDIDENDYLNLDRAVNLITALPLKDRIDIFENVSNSKTFVLTETEVLKHNFTTGNITLSELLKKFPTLETELGEDIDINSDYNIIFTHNFELNNTNYNGRVLTKDGKEMFVIKSFYGARTFIKYLKAKKIVENIFKEGSFPESISNLKKELELVASHFKMSVAELLNEYLDNKESFKTFVKNGKIIVPKKYISKALYALTENFEYSENYTELEAGIHDYTKKRSDFKWEITSENLYNILKGIFPEVMTMSEESFKVMDAESLNQLFYGENGIFRGHPKLERSVIEDVFIENESATIETEKEVDVPLTIETIKSNWESIRNAEKNKNLDIPENYNEAKKHENFIKWIENAEDEVKIIGEDNEEHSIKVKTNKKGNYIFYYTYTKKGTKDNKEFKPSTITFNFPFATIGEIYDFGYNTKSIFSPVNESFVKDGMYKGMYVYKATIKTLKGDKEVYAISRSIISPNSYMATFPTLETALAGIESKNDKDIIIENSNYSIRKSNSAPRESFIEMKAVQQGQILTVSDYTIGNIQYKNLNNNVKSLLEMTFGEFKNIFTDNAEIQKIENPEDAFSFLMTISKELNTENMDLGDYINAIKKFEGIKVIIDNILNTTKSSYFVEKLISYTDKQTKLKRKLGTLRLLKNNGNSVNFEGSHVGDVELQTFLKSNLERVADDFKNNYGIDVITLSADELEELNKSENLGITDAELETVRAFVHNGQIYINTSNADISDLFHEISHLFLGAIKVRDFDSYEEILDRIVNNKKNAKRFESIYKYKKSSYANLAETDLVEEAVVELIAEKMFKQDFLVEDYIPEKFKKFMEEIMGRVQNITQDANTENTIGFDSFMKNLLNQTKDESKKRRAVTNFIATERDNGSITENCK